MSKVLDLISNRYFFSILLHFLLIAISLFNKNVPFYKIMLIIATVSFTGLNLLIFNLKVIKNWSRKILPIIVVSFIFFVILNIIIGFIFLYNFLTFAEFLKLYLIPFVVLGVIRFLEFVDELIQQIYIAIDRSTAIFKSTIILMFVLLGFSTFLLLADLINFNIFILIVFFGKLITTVYIVKPVLRLFKNSSDFMLLETFNQLKVVFFNNILQRSLQVVARGYIASTTTLDFFYFFNIMLYFLLPVSVSVNIIKYRFLKIKDVNNYRKYLIVLFLLFELYGIFLLVAFSYIFEISGVLIIWIFIFLTISFSFSIVWLMEQTILTYFTIKKLMVVRSALFLFFLTGLALNYTFSLIDPFIFLTLAYSFYLAGIVVFLFFNSGRDGSQYL